MRRRDSWRARALNVQNPATGVNGIVLTSIFHSIQDCTCYPRARFLRCAHTPAASLARFAAPQWHSANQTSRPELIQFRRWSMCRTVEIGCAATLVLACAVMVPPSLWGQTLEVSPADHHDVSPPLWSIPSHAPRLRGAERRAHPLPLQPGCMRGDAPQRWRHIMVDRWTYFQGL